jgi:hypothetical protein
VTLFCWRLENLSANLFLIPVGLWWKNNAMKIKKNLHPRLKAFNPHRKISFLRAERGEKGVNQNRYTCMRGMGNAVQIGNCVLSQRLCKLVTMFYLRGCANW